MPVPRPIIFLHVPKAGGTTVREQLRAWFPRARHLQFTSPEMWDEMSDDEIAHYDVLTGHIGFRFVSRVPNAFLITFLRDPMERAVSQFYYHKNNLKTFGDKELTFKDYLDSGRSGFAEILDNGIVWQFAWDQYLRYRDLDRFSDDQSLYAQALDNIRKVDFLGFQETLDQDLQRLQGVLGLGLGQVQVRRANASIAKPLRVSVSWEDRARFEQRARLDVQFVRAMREIEYNRCR